MLVSELNRQSFI